MTREAVVLLGGPDEVQAAVKDRGWTFETERMKELYIDKIFFGEGVDTKHHDAKFVRTEEHQDGKRVYRYAE